MQKTYIRQLFHPKLKEPILIEGLPGFGNVGKIAAQLLIKFTQAKLFTELYSPSLPDYVTINKNGICQAPHYQFYASTKSKPHLIILTGNTQPSIDDPVAHYKICGKIIDFAEQHGCKFIVTMGGVPMPRPAGQVYVAATSPKRAAEIMEKGAAIYGGGKIMGATGLLLGLAKSRGWKGACLLGATTALKADKEAAFSVFKFLMKMLGTDVERGL
ncbi:proteasome assembly chaperone family protein [Candidatus Bathyarchaeota archaeon]|nr:proteasome assembly chaperone family protein [Candidatus Bathyarchaeota archaeon]